MFRARPVLATLLVVASALLASCATGSADAGPPAEAPAPSPDRMTEWQEIERLIDEQKYQAAADLVAPLREASRASGDHPEWARALVVEVQLRTALHGYTRAVELLREPWPEGDRERALLGLFYADGLVEYLRAYDWEVRQRERVADGGTFTLESATLGQILAEANASFERVWSEREAGWAAEPARELSDFIEPATYPERIRGTARDTLSYLWVELLADSSYWRPEHSNRIYRLDLQELISPPGPGGEVISDPAAHPLRRITAVLADLEAWHRASGRLEAAAEARFERLRRLRGSFDRAADREVLREALESALSELGRAHAWWSSGQATLAEWVGQEEDPDSRIRARDLAREGAAAHPKSVGGLRCAHLVASLEAPAVAMASMATDGAGRRSVRLTHRNLDRVYLRSYRFDPKRRPTESQDYNLLPDRRDLRRLLERGQPALEWVEELPATPDLRDHTTYVTPPLTEPGGYLIVISSHAGFSMEEGLSSALPLLITDLVLVRRQQPGRLEVTVRSGETGAPVEGATVGLWRRDYQGGHREVDRLVSSGDGRVEFSVEDTTGHGYFLLAEKDGEVTLDEGYLTFAGEAEERHWTGALVYTDRSVYRPGQEVLWKLVAYQGHGRSGELKTRSETEVEVELIDPNGESVEQVTLQTNEFGSVSGRFTIPPGRRLGHWTLRGHGGGASLRVEEYKRPTFEVAILDPDGPLRLNRPATLAGEARYYFGLPVTSGEVDWRVERVALYPRWWYWRPGRLSASETVAAGSSELDAEGRFSVEFVPEADERESADGVTYNYRLSADVTDEGGETRSASRGFRLGFVNVEAHATFAEGFLTAGERVSLEIRRQDFDGRPKEGSGRWTLLQVERPDVARLPADQPRLQPVDERYATEGDRLRPRWQAAPAPEQLWRRWPDGRALLDGVAEHADDGVADVELGELEPGLYRLRYETEDDFDTPYEMRAEFLVVGEGARRMELPALLLLERASVSVGESARLLVDSGLEHQQLVLEVVQDGERLSRQVLDSGDGPHLIELPIGEELRGGVAVHLTAVRDHQLMSSSASIFVPWDDRELAVEFESFRDRLQPGARERWSIRLRGKDGRTLERGAAELLAYMYDRSLDLFAPHNPPRVGSLYPRRMGYWNLESTLGERYPIWRRVDRRPAGYPTPRGAYLKFFDDYPIGGPGDRRFMALKSRAEMVTVTSESPLLDEEVGDPRPQALPAPEQEADAAFGIPEGAGEPPLEEGLRQDFSETAFWEPHLVSDAEGSVAFEFEVPDSLTEWSVWVHALTRDLRGGSIQRAARSAKELMVRPYLPRFLREGDEADLRVTVNNASDDELSGTVDLEIVDPATGASVLDEFGLSREDVEGVGFTVAAGAGATLEFPLRAPTRVGEVAFRVRARAGDLADGELRPLPLLPGRMHLSQSRFAALHGDDRRELTFADLAADDDPTRIDEQLVVTLDAQLFYSVLQALPYLTDYPYECTEQTLNRFVSTGIVSSLYDRYPAVARMAREFSERETRLERWDRADPNRKMGLEETPWLRFARGGGSDDLINVLDPEIAAAQRRVALAKLEEAQTSLGGFPWWPGGPPSPYMTLYLVYGFSKALEFDVDVPREMVASAWRYLEGHYSSELEELVEEGAYVELVTFLNYVLSNYPDASWTGGVFGEGERARMLEHSFRHWREHSPLLKGYLALTLQRAGRAEDARLVWDSVMDSARTTRDEGTFWAAEEKSWLWYNDTIEGHALALRVLGELSPDDARRHGLVQWLLMNKKLSHWKSTRATAEVIYSLIHYLEEEGQLGVREAARVIVGPVERDFVFEPDEYTGRGNRVVIAGDDVDAAMSTTVIEKETPGLLFASATWHFSTERLPTEASGDLFSVRRELYRRVREGAEWVLRPLAAEERIEIGDQVEVHLVISARHAAEYVHLRDPRAAGFEPESQISDYRWNLGIGWFEEIRDSGTNFFFDRLPVGSYTLKHRLRATTAGTFRSAPATLQSMYAPEFTGYSAGQVVSIGR